uniref:Syndecan 4 n=1 Tax=Canis lupus familiaris TaxID=9615 RepID=A0A8I3NU11_CANLF
MRSWCCFVLQDHMVQPARWQKQTPSLAECFHPLPWVCPQTMLSVDLSSFHPIQVPLDNHIPEKAGPGSWVPTEPKELEENEVIPKRISPFEGDEDVSNKVSMSSTAQGGNIFERTEVLAALIVGGGVGILFAIFLVLLLVYRMKKKDEGTYDLGKKPIYKKAPTNEFYA